MKRLFVFLLTVVMMISSSCVSPHHKNKYTEYFFDYFDTVTEISGYESSKKDFDRVVEEVKDKLTYYHKLYDIYNEYEGINNIATINRKARFEENALEVSEEIIDLLLYAKELCELTDGKFDPSMGLVTSIWHDHREKGKRDPENAELPSREALMEADSYTDINKLVINSENGTVYIDDSKMTMDVGAIAKGYACEQTAKYLDSQNISGYILNIGGNVRTVGSKPDGNDWTIGIENPIVEENPYVFLASVSGGKSVVTSGVYQRFYIVDGKKYHHIIDPETLMPSDRYLSVSVLSSDSGLGDALSTALYNMDYNSGKALVESLTGVEALWVLESGEILYTDGFTGTVSD